ncbi:MAG: hypothetical protein A4E25_00050 [Methanobacterium sp. PtaB.Bin024]|nr:MAG: hypothetical protein A4E25_00050 [Methanobacterium sp. PtaB.Bin024]
MEKEMPWDNIISTEEYTKRSVRDIKVCYELCTPDCPYYCEKHLLKPKEGK